MCFCHSEPSPAARVQNLIRERLGFFDVMRCRTPQNDRKEVPNVMLRIPPLAGAEASLTQQEEILRCASASLELIFAHESREWTRMKKLKQEKLNYLNQEF